MKKFVKALSSKLSSVLSEEFVNDLISSFGGCLLLYENLLGSKTAEIDLVAMKNDHTQHLKSAFSLQDNQLFSIEHMRRYELLEAVDRGEKILSKQSPAAEYLLAKHGKIPAFLGVHPEGHLIFALKMTKQSLKEVDALVIIKKLLLK